MLLSSCSTPTFNGVQATAGFGLSRDAAIEVCRFRGRDAYFSKLLCPDGRRPTFHRVVNVGSRGDMPSDLTPAQVDSIFKALQTDSPPPLRPGDPDYHIVDHYIFTCEASQVSVFVDMYHCEKPEPKVAPRGLKLLDPSAKR